MCGEKPCNFLLLAVKEWFFRLQKAWPQEMRKPLSHSIATREELVAIGKTALATAGVFRRVRVLLAAVQRFRNNANFVNMRSTKSQERHSKNVLRSSTKPHKHGRLTGGREL